MPHADVRVGTVHNALFRASTSATYQLIERSTEF